MNKLSKILSSLIGLLLFLLPWQTIWIYREYYLNNYKLQYGTLGLYGTEILLWVCAVLFMFWFWKKRKIESPTIKLKLTKDRIFLIFLLLFSIYTLISSCWAINFDIAYQQALHIMEAILLFLMLLTGPLGTKEIIKYFTAGAVVQGLLGIYQFSTQSTFSFKWLGIVSHPAWEAGTSIISNQIDGRWLRAYGGFSHPNILGGYLALTLVIIFIFFIKQKTKLTGYHGLIITILVSALFLTFSRSAWLAFIIFLLAILLLSFKNKEKNIIQLSYFTSALILMFCVIYFPLIQTRFSQNTVNEIRSTTERITGYREAWKIFKANPLLGVGIGNYTLASYNLNKNLPGWDYQPVHNIYLLLLAELGLIGTTLLALAVIASARFLSLFKHNEAFVYITVFIMLTIFDHYLIYSLAGLLLSGAYFAIICRNFSEKS